MFLFFVGLIGFLVCLVILIVRVVRKKSKKVLGILTAVFFVLGIVEYSGAVKPQFRKIGNRESGTGKPHASLLA